MRQQGMAMTMAMDLGLLVGKGLRQAGLGPPLGVGVGVGVGLDVGVGEVQQRLLPMPCLRIARVRVRFAPQKG